MSTPQAKQTATLKRATSPKNAAPAKAASPKNAAPAKAAPAKAALAKATSARVTPKKSPLAGTTLDDYISAKALGWQATVARKLVDIVATAAPESTASIKWGQPVFDSNGPFAYFRPSKNHLTLGFWRGTELSDPKGLLEGEGDRMKHLKITSPEGVDEKTIRAWVKQAVVLNREKGNPASSARRKC